MLFVVDTRARQLGSAALRGTQHGPGAQREHERLKICDIQTIVRRNCRPFGTGNGMALSQIGVVRQKATKLVCRSWSCRLVAIDAMSVKNYHRVPRP